MMDYATLALTMIWAHLLFDYALQGDFMARAKSRDAPIAGVPALTVLASHAFLQAGPVAFLTGSLLLGATEFSAHFAIDAAKCRGQISFNQDQAIHIACKLVWAAVAISARSGG